MAEAVPERHYPPFYPQLDYTRKTIRILVLKPSVDEAALIETELKTSYMDDPRRHQYEALSYTWGNPGDTLPIRVNGYEFPITKNLHTALRRLRLRTQTRTLWIDAICIKHLTNAQIIKTLVSPAHIHRRTLCRLLLQQAHSYYPFGY